MASSGASGTLRPLHAGANSPDSKFTQRNQGLLERPLSRPHQEATVRPTDIDTDKSNCHLDRGDQRLSEWPPLPKIEDLQDPLNSCVEQWLDCEAPSELSQLTVDCPSEVVRIVRQSLQKEQYAPASQKITPQVAVVVEEVDGDCPQSDEQTRSELDRDMQQSKTDDASPCILQDPSAVSVRSGLSSFTSRPRRSISGAMAWLTGKGTKARGEKGVRSLPLSTTPETGGCASCFETMLSNQTVSLECQHKYCVTCFSKLVETAMRVEDLFPPKCCLTKIPQKVILSHLTSDLKKHYRRKAEEYAVAVSNRWYCPSASCGAWIPPSKIKRRLPVQKCHRCRSSICSVCRGRAHKNGECPQETGLRETLEEAEMQGWRRCYSCHAMVELSSGCRHITCKCKAEFCYVCGARWDTCDCTQEDQYHREEELSLLRADRSREAQEEAELAAAISAVEAMERREEEERIREEALRRRREEEQSRERELRRSLQVAERMQKLQDSLRTTNWMQRTLILNRQEHQAQQFDVQAAARKIRHDTACKVLIGHLEANFRSRMDSLRAAQAVERKRLQTEHEEEEDEIIAKMSRLLKGCANIDDREKSILRFFRNTQKQERDEMRQRHKKGISDLVHKSSLEWKGLRAGLLARKEEQQKQEREQLRGLIHSAIIQRTWFDRVIAKRQELLQEYRNEVENSGQPIEELEMVIATTSKEVD